MRFKKTRPALLVALALQQLYSPAFAQTPTNEGKSDKSTDATQLPEIKVNSQKVTDDFAASSFAGFRTPTPLRDVPQTVTVVNRALMDSQAIASLSEALRNVPGITVGGAEGGQIGNNINLRGFTARTDMYLNGMRDSGQYYRDTYYLESVEVLKGPSSMLFGRGSTGGVINQVSKRPQLGDANQVTGTIDTNGGVRSTGDFNRQLSDTSAVRVVMMGQKAQTTRDVIVNRDFGIAPSLRFGMGTQTEITLSAILSHNNDIVDYGIPSLNGRPVKVDRDTFYGLRDDKTVQNTAIITPVAFNIFGEMASDEYEKILQGLAAYGSGAFLGLWVVLPSLLGIAVRLIISKDRQTGDMHYLKFINSIVLLLLNYSNASVSLPQAIADRDYDFLACTLAISAGLCLTLFAAGYVMSRLFKLERDDRTSLMFGLGMNNNGTGLVLASLALSSYPNIMVPIIFYNLIQHIVAGIVNEAMNKRANGSAL